MVRSYPLPVLSLQRAGSYAVWAWPIESATQKHGCPRRLVGDLSSHLS